MKIIFFSLNKTKHFTYFLLRLQVISKCNGKDQNWSKVVKYHKHSFSLLFSIYILYYSISKQLILPNCLPTGTVKSVPLKSICLWLLDSYSLDKTDEGKQSNIYKTKALSYYSERTDYCTIYLFSYFLHGWRGNSFKLQHIILIQQLLVPTLV